MRDDTFMLAVLYLSAYFLMFIYVYLVLKLVEKGKRSLVETC